MDVSCVGKHHIAAMEDNLNSSIPLTAGGLLPEGPRLAGRLVGHHSPVLCTQLLSGAEPDGAMAV